MSRQHSITLWQDDARSAKKPLFPTVNDESTLLYNVDKEGVDAAQDLRTVIVPGKGTVLV